MRLTLFALAAVLPTFGAAFANDIGSIMVFPSFDGVPVRQPHAAPYTAMPGVAPDFPSKTSLGVPGRMRYLFREAPVRSTVRNGAKPLIQCADPTRHAD